MDVERLSASSVATFESCEARYRAVYIDRGVEISGAAADAGTAAHDALEEVVGTLVEHSAGRPSEAKPEFNLKNILKIYERHASRLGIAADLHDVGRQMMKNWYDFHHANGFNEIIATETKATFDLTHPRLGTIPFTYIFDRADWNDARQAIEIIDYKTFAMPMSADDLKRKTQVRAYGVAAAIEFKFMNPHAVSVFYHLLRYDRVGVTLTREDNVSTWHYLQDVWERIVDSDGTIETPNPECRWCIRKTSCDTLRRHVNAGGVLGLGPEAIAVTLDTITNQIKALNVAKTELEDALSDHLDSLGTSGCTFDSGVSVTIKPSGRRDVDGHEAATVIGPDLLAKYGTVGVTMLDKIMKDEPELTDEQRARLKTLITRKAGAKLEVKVPTSLDDL